MTRSVSNNTNTTSCRYKIEGEFFSRRRYSNRHNTRLLVRATIYDYCRVTCGVSWTVAYAREWWMMGDIRAPFFLYLKRDFELQFVICITYSFCALVDKKFIIGNAVITQWMVLKTLTIITLATVVAHTNGVSDFENWCTYCFFFFLCVFCLLKRL